MTNFIKKSFLAAVVTALVISSFVGGVYLGYNNRPEIEKVTSLLSKEDTIISSQIDFNSFWKAWNVIEDKYVANGELNRQDMVWGAISGLVASLEDPYSVFFPPIEAEIFESTVRGDFAGVGMEIGIRGGILTVVAPLKDTPAYRAGMKAGDKIIKIDDTISADLTIEEAVKLIRGEIGTSVKLTVLRESNGQEPIEVNITRDTIKIPALETEQKEDGIFVIRLYSFSGNSTVEFREALREMIDSGSTSLIIDLRGNSGGYLEAAIDISSWFLPMGDVVVREHFSDDKEKEYKSKGYGFLEGFPTVILVDGGSASASEITAGALSEHGAAKLIGKKTYGKGSVQELVPIKDGSSLKITIARWLTPNGKSISKEGLEPDIEVDYTKEDFEAERDPQMSRAIEYLKEIGGN